MNLIRNVILQRQDDMINKIKKEESRRYQELKKLRDAEFGIVIQ